jgi:hypothetical protein
MLTDAFFEDLAAHVRLAGNERLECVLPWNHDVVLARPPKSSTDFTRSAMVRAQLAGHANNDGSNADTMSKRASLGPQL